MGRVYICFREVLTTKLIKCLGNFIKLSKKMENFYGVAFGPVKIDIADLLVCLRRKRARRGQVLKNGASGVGNAPIRDRRPSYVRPGGGVGDAGNLFQRKKHQPGDQHEGSSQPYDTNTAGWLGEGRLPILNQDAGSDYI